MSNIIRELLYDLESTKAIDSPEGLPYQAGVLGPDAIVQARQMLAQVYVLTGNVDPKDLTDQNTLNDKVDPYWKHSTYFGVWDKNNPGKLLMAARLVHPANEGLSSLQIHLDELDADYREELLRRDPSTIAELAAYVKAPALEPVASRLCSLFLIRDIMRFSRDNNIETWVFGLRPQLRPKYERLFGPGLDRRGKTVHLGSFKSEFLPYSVDVERSWRRLLTESSPLRIGSQAIARFVGSVYDNTDSNMPNQLPRRGTPRAKIAH